MKSPGGATRAVAALAISIMSLAGLPNAALAGSGPAVVAPSTAFTQMGQLSNAGIPLTVTWPVGTPDGAPLAHYELQKSIDGGTWTQIPLSKPLIRSVTVRVNAWSLFVFRLRAVDTAGVPGDWADASPRWLSFSQESEPEVGLTGGWQVVKDKAALGHRRAVTWTADESATFSFVGRQVAWLGRLGPNRGTASVSSSLGTTNVNLARSNASSQRIVFRATWPANGAHAVSITSTSPTKAVDVDAFLVLSDPPEGQLVGAGDISTCTNDNDTATAGVVASVLDANPLALAYTTGDNVYSKGTAAQFANCYDPTWGAFKARTRPTPGNHDYDDPGAAGYYAYFGENAGPAGKGWYRFEAGTWRVYAMNSECAVGSTCANSQLNWLKADLSANPHKCVLAIWHRPRFSTGLHGNSMRMAQAFSELYNFGADVVVGGHDHGYQRFMPATPSGVSDPTNGLRTFVAGMGGASLYRWKTTSPLLETRDNTTHGALRLDLHPGGYSWAFMPVAGATSYSDSGTAACH